MSKLSEILGLFPQLKWICVDVANGYSECFVEFVIKSRSQVYGKDNIHE